MEWGKVILVEVYERILRCWLYGRSIWMNFALLNAFNIYCVTLTGILRQKCSVMILIWIHRWLFCWFRLRYRTFWWVFLCSVISGLNKNYVDPGRPLSVRQFVCVCVSTNLGRCWWKFDHITSTKNLDDAFLRFSKFWFCDVITTFLSFSMRHSNVFSFCAICFKSIKSCSSAHCFVWDCKPAFSVHIFYPK